MNFIRLMPNDVVHFWPVIQKAIIEAEPEIFGESPRKLARIQGAILSGAIDAWVLVEDVDIEKELHHRVHAVVICEVTIDYATTIRNYYVRTIHVREKSEIDVELWKTCLEAIKVFARQQGCDRVIGHVGRAEMAHLLVRIGCEAKYVFITCDLEAN